jgi:tetratricopeptide (TPR) repeat protein
VKAVASSLRRHLRVCASVALLLALAACGTTQQPPAVAASPVIQASAPPADLQQRTLTEFEARQRALADTAGAQGRWAEAIAALEILHALKPADEALVQQLTRAQGAAEAAARERLQIGRQANQRGDSEAAARAYLEALMLSPAMTEAADALRAIERERVRRQHLGKLSRYAIGNTAAALQAEPVSQAVQNEIEHATMLADQGEFDGAVATLKPLADRRGAEQQVVSLLAEVYFRQAESLGNGNKPAAIAALERCIKLDRTHARAAALLKVLKAR